MCVVQELPSSHVLSTPPVHCPLTHFSPTVHVLPSLHALPSPLAVNTHPLAGLHESVVHTLLSSHTLPTPWQIVLVHKSLIVQALPSSQLAPTFKCVCVHPLALLHASVVQELPSSQLIALPPPQVPPLQVSPLVHLSPSSQVPPSLPLVNKQPLLGSHESTVQASPSLQVFAVPLQVLPTQPSSVVQPLPSSQAVPAVTVVWTQPVGAVQESAVQGLPSLQLVALPP